MKIKIKDLCGENTVTREDGKKIHSIIEKNWDKDKEIVVDFGNIVIASISFMDEALGVLALKRSKKDIISKIKVIGIKSSDRKLLNDIMVTRFKNKSAT